jgi:hypothetical protein
MQKKKQKINCFANYQIGACQRHMAFASRILPEI